MKVTISAKIAVPKIFWMTLYLLLMPIVLGYKILGIVIIDILRVFLILFGLVMYLFKKVFLVKPIPLGSPPEQENPLAFQFTEERVSGLESYTDVENLKVEKFESYRTSEKERCAFLIPYVVSQWDIITPVDQVVRNAYETLRFNGNIPNEKGVRKCTALFWKSDSAIGVIELQCENKWEITNIQKIKISFYRPGKGGGQVKVNIQLREAKQSFVAFINYTDSIEETESDVHRLRNLFEPSIALEIEDQGYNS